MVQGRRVDGFVIVRTRRQDARIDYLCKVDFPFVSFGRTEGECDFAYVDEDGGYGMHLIVDHLINSGYTRIGFIAAPENLMFAEYRLMGFLDALRKRNISIEDSLIITGDLTQRSGYSQANQLLDLRNPPQAIVACNDLMAFGAMSAAQQRGLIVGVDIAVVGFDDVAMAEHFHPPLTTVHQPVYKIGGMVTEMLIKQIRGEKPEAEQIILKPSLVVRKSCGGSIQNENR
jgi:DNA-binding LacI/PurR family transcriptional regulator